ncbi:MAG: hypothetical protein ACK6A7_20205, partial [Planctomycetota bacterium]
MVATSGSYHRIPQYFLPFSRPWREKGSGDEGGVPCSGQSMAPLAQGTGAAGTRETLAQLLVQGTILGRAPSN